jgi:hypothetical protein
MRPIHYAADAIVALLRERKIATLSDLMTALGTDAPRTAFRKLKEVGYRTSYSHRGAYYTLDEIAAFDELGLWTFQDVWFSRHGTLLSTAQATVEAAEHGYFVEELDHVLHVATKDPLRKLVTDERLAREPMAGRLLYCARDPERRRIQVVGRHALLADPGLLGPLPEVASLPDELRAAIVLFFSLLDERQRRLYAGLEALRTGRGGDDRIAALFGLDPGTVARGRRELLDRDVQVDRVRRGGGGRRPAEKKRRS